MKEQKYYVVVHGRKTGVFDNWNECEEQVAFFRRAQFKKVGSIDEAIRYFVEESEGEPPFVISIQGRRQQFYDYGSFLDALEVEKENEESRKK